ncbi:hypothetical protein DXY21_03852 [Bacillus velezensis]|nr:hypothetical protein DXY21_03852 [Bacillus velezensis]
MKKILLAVLVLGALVSTYLSSGSTQQASNDDSSVKVAEIKVGG